MRARTILASDRAPLCAAACAAALALCSACDSGAREVRWAFRFDPESLGDGAQAIVARIREGGCGGERVLFEADVTREAAAPAPPRLGPGAYGLEGVALDATCARVASGCLPVTLPLAGAEVEVVLESGDGLAECEPGHCAGGRCTGRDAGVPPSDAGPRDATVDGGCEPGSCAPPVRHTLAVALLHACALRASGTVACWGDDEFGQLGDGSPAAASAAPVDVMGLTGAVELALGRDHSCALRTSGTIACWGSNEFGQLGSVRGYAYEPHDVANVIDAVRLAAGQYHTCGLRASGAVICWGSNSEGQLGDGTTTSTGSGSIPGAGVAGLTDAVEVVAGENHTCALRASGAVICWGENNDGQLGDGTVTLPRLIPVGVLDLTDAVELAAGRNHTCARLASGTVVCWGDNIEGQLGDGTSIGRSAPGDEVVDLLETVGLAAGVEHTCARDAWGEVLCWGRNDFGQLGDGLTISRPIPDLVADLDAVEIAAGGFRTCARRTSGVVACWGRYFTSTPVDIAGL